MEPIHVPGPPKEAFNKNRPISDLIRAQVNHLKHVEAKSARGPAQQNPAARNHHRIRRSKLYRPDDRTLPDQSRRCTRQTGDSC